MRTATPRNTPKRTRQPPKHPPKMHPKTFQGLPIVVLAVLAALLPVSAQDLVVQRPMENVYARPGQPTQIVYVAGAVALPGRWRVEQSVQLWDLLAVANPSVVTTEGSQTLEDARVLVYRVTNQGRSPVFNESVESLLTSGSASLSLEEGDIVVVNLIEIAESTTISLGDVVSIVSSVAGLALTFYALLTR